MRFKKGFISVLVIFSIIGIFTILYRLAHGLRVTALSSAIPWGMWVAWYAYFVGVSTGTFLLSTLIHIFKIQRLASVGRLLLLVSLICILTALIFILLDLGHPARFWHVFVSPQWSSILEWEIWFYNLFVICLFFCLWFLMRCDLDNLADNSQGIKKFIYRLLSLSWRCPDEPDKIRLCHARSLQWVRLFSIIAILPCLAGGTGAIFAVVAAKPYWFSAIIPAVFLVSALASGTAAVTFLYAFFFRNDKDYQPRLFFLRNILFTFIVLDLFLLILEYLIGFYGGVPEHLEVYFQIMFGPFPYVFWLGQIGLATIVPIVIFSLPRTRIDSLYIGAASLACAIGLVAVRLNLIVPALVIPMLEGLDTAFQDKRLVYFYFPSIWEWLSSVGLMSIMCLIFMGLFNLLPIKKEDL